MNIEEGNKAIATYMGYKFNAYPDLRHNNITKPGENEWYFASWFKEDINTHLRKEFHYHVSFDSLMPVVQRILATTDQGLSVYMLYVSDALRTADINQVWQAVVDCIESFKPVTP